MKKEWNISSDEDGMIIRFEDTGRGLIPSCIYQKGGFILTERRQVVSVYPHVALYFFLKAASVMLSALIFCLFILD